MEFSNRPSEVVFLSRSVAVMVVPVYLLFNDLFVPLGRRSAAVSDEGKWCLPCGYLDWDETGRDAAIREAWEEIGIDLTGCLGTQPWFVQSDPAQDARQNVTLRFGAIIECPNNEHGTPTLPTLKTSSEVESVKWRLVEPSIISDDLAFNHGNIILDFLRQNVDSCGLLAKFNWLN
jgi:8-oxo-dGTP pyrophosphatase MutT (NUDIX family)